MIYLIMVKMMKAKSKMMNLRDCSLRCKRNSNAVISDIDHRRCLKNGIVFFCCRCKNYSFQNFPPIFTPHMTCPVNSPLPESM